MEISVNINNDLARVLARFARAKACEIKVPMVIAFADAVGGLVHFQRMDKALPVSSDIARNKAFTSAALRIPTHVVGPLTQPGKELYGLELTNQGRLVIFGGGFPLTFSGRVIGAIGVSGGSVDEDMSVAKAAVDALEQMEKISGPLARVLPDTPGEQMPDLAVRVAKMGLPMGISPDIIEGAFYLISKS